jgi:hypothetical protein
MRFIVTKELGRLSRWLRILGFDVVYFKSDNIGTLILEALREDRLIVTRKKRKIGDLEKKTVMILSAELEEQLKEIISKAGLKIEENKMFTRCTVCNCVLQEVKKEDVKEMVPEYVYKSQNFFMCCPECKKIYWQGSHWGNIKEVIAKLSLKWNS